MQTFKLTYDNGSTERTCANGTLEEVTAYFMQFGGLRVDEDPNTGKETRRWLVKVEFDDPDTGDIYTFNYEGKPCKLVVTKVTRTHVYYKFIDGRLDTWFYEYSMPMVKSVWYENADNRKLTGFTTEPAALTFITREPVKGE